MSERKQQELPSEVRSDTFFALSIPDAIRKYLAIAKGPQTLSDITNALQRGGLITTSKNLVGTVSATLVRIKRTDGDVVPVQGKWGLTEWYRGLRQEKIEALSKPKGHKRGRSKKTSKAKLVSQQKPSSPTPEQIDQMQTLHGHGKTFGEIAKELHIPTLTVWRTLTPKKNEQVDKEKETA